MTSPLQPFLDQHGCLVLDGGLATALEQRGFDLSSSLWSAELLQTRPDAIRDVHLAYLEAGANCLITASYQASLPGFTAHGFSPAEAELLLRRSVTLGQEAREIFLAATNSSSKLRPLIAASIGPYGAYLANGAEYRGNYGLPQSELREFHQARWEILVDSGAELFACETIPDWDETQVLLDLLLDTPKQSAWFSFSCPDGMHISDGTPIRECARLLADHEQVAAIGVNCTAPQYIPSLINQIAEVAPRKPIIVYPNSGEVYDGESRCWRGSADPTEFGQSAQAWRTAGATVIGGCCRTDPTFIRVISEVLQP